MKYLWLFLVLMLSISGVLGIQVDEKIVSNVIVNDFEDPAEFELLISNASEGMYNIYTLTDVKILPRDKFRLGNKTNRLEIFVYPLEGFEFEGMYTFGYIIQNEEGFRFNDRLSVKFVNFQDLIELEAGEADFSTGEVEFYVKNKENIFIEDIEASFSSFLFDINRTFDLEPNGVKKIVVETDVDELKRVNAGRYILNAEFRKGDSFSEDENTIFIGEEKGIVSEEDLSGFLIVTETFTKINSGNVPETVSVVVEKDIFSRLFTSFNIRPVETERDGFSVRYSWSERLGPSEIFNVKVKTNYLTPIVVILIAGFIVYGLRKYLRGVIDIKKSVSYVKTKGGEFALRVTLKVNAKKRIENAALIDKVPAIVKIYKKFGSVKPDKFDTKNRRVQWNIGNLEAGEERVYSYVVYSKVGVVGRFSLPEALLVYEKEGEIHESESNKVLFLSEQSKKAE